MRLRKAAARASHFVSELIYERRYGLDTTASARPVFAADFDGTGADYNAYIAASWRQLQRWLSRRAVTADDVFLDVGCGKGRVVFQAARLYPFKRVIGLELSPELAEIARANIDRNLHRLRCRNVEIVVADAASWTVPDDVTFVFLYNSFSGAVFEQFVEQLMESVDRRPRTVQIIYSNPLEASTLEATGRVRLLRETTAPQSRAQALLHKLNSDRDYGVKVYALEPLQLGAREEAAT